MDLMQQAPLGQALSGLMRGASCVDASQVLLQVNNDRQQQEQNQEKNEGSTYSMEQQMRQQSPSQVPSPLCMLVTVHSASDTHQTGQLRQLREDCLGICTQRAAWGVLVSFSHTYGCSSLQLRLTALQMCMKRSTKIYSY